MGCCVGAKYDNWCKDVEIVWEDPEKKEEYCLFHAPAEHKKMSEDEFSKKAHTYLKEIPSCWVTEREAVRLSAAIFISDVTFEDTELPTLNLDDAIFLKDLTFKNILFNDNLNFDNTHCWGDVSFKDVTVEGECSFLDSSFERELRFYDVIAPAGLSATFKTPPNGLHLDLKECDGVVYFRSESNKLTWLTLTVPVKNNPQLTLEINKLNLLSLDLGSLVTIPVIIRNSEIDSFYSEDYRFLTPISFSNCSFNELFLSARSLDNIKFFSCKFPQLNSRTTTTDAITTIHETPFVTPTEPHKLEELYRALKRQAQNEENRRLASDWHYWEKFFCEKRLFTDGTFFEWLILRLYRMLSDYGESVGKASWCLLLFIFAPFCFSFIAQELPNTLLTNWWLATKQHAIDFIPLATRAPETSENLITIPRLLQVAWQILITFQATLLGFALRNRYRR